MQKIRTKFKHVKPWSEGDCSVQKLSSFQAFARTASFNFGGNSEKYKAAGGEKVILASLIDDAHVIVAFGIGVWQDRINLATLKRHFIVRVVNTDCDTMIRVLIFHS